MKTQLVRVVTSDKLILQGVLYQPDQKTDKIIVHIHGMGGNFYENHFLDLMAEQFTKNGFALLSGNNRGHDLMADFVLEGDKEEYKRIGCAFEKFEESVIDIKTWLDFVENQGFGELILQGHSLGCCKAVYYLAQTKDPRIKKLILAAPPDMIKLTENWEGFNEMLELAKQLVTQGKGQEILPKQLDGWYYLSANTFLEHSQRGGSMNIFNVSDPNSSSKSLAEINIPILTLIGSEDFCTVIPAQEALEIIKKKAKNCPDFQTKIIQGTGHSYFGKEKEVSRLVIEWLTIDN